MGHTYSLWGRAPKMGRRHYIYIAEIIQELDIPEKRRKIIAEKFAGALMHTNNAFKYQRFVDYATKKPTLEV